MGMLLLRRWRHRRGLTVSELAERAGVHPVTLVRIEGGWMNPTVGTLMKLAGGLGISPRALLPSKGEGAGHGEE